MLKRPYGKSDALSVIGFAGIIVMNESQADADRYVAEALADGVNYFDVAPSYGNAEERLGPALAGRRQDVFLACKTEKRTRAEAEAALHNSLRVLQTDHFDLYQIHAVNTLEDVEKVFAPDGVMDLLLKARQAGKIRHLGFSSHSDEAALAMLDRFRFDSVMYPLSWLTYLREGFGRSVVERAQQDDLTLIAIKALARCAWPEDLKSEERPYPKCWYEPLTDPAIAALALRFTLSLPVASAITPGDIRLYRLAIKLAEDLRPLTEDEIALLKQQDLTRQAIFPL